MKFRTNIYELFLEDDFCIGDEEPLRREDIAGETKLVMHNGTLNKSGCVG